jgi:opacity protein-like surface antigen
MKTRLKNVFFIIVFFFCLNLILISQSYAADNAKNPYLDKSYFPVRGVYLELFGVQSGIGGDFNDEFVLSADTAMYNVPKVKTGSGFGIALGGRSDTWAYELNYFETSHVSNTLFTDIGSQDASFGVFDIDFKFDLTRSQLRPYVKLGMGLTSLTIDNSKINMNEEYLNETFRGYCYNLGGGLEYFITKNWAIDACVVYRFNKFRTVDSISIENSLSGSGTNLLLGIAYIF